MYLKIELGKIKVLVTIQNLFIQDNPLAIIVLEFDTIFENHSQ